MSTQMVGCGVEHLFLHERGAISCTYFCADDPFASSREVSRVYTGSQSGKVLGDIMLQDTGMKNADWVSLGFEAETLKAGLPKT